MLGMCIKSWVQTLGTDDKLMTDNNNTDDDDGDDDPAKDKTCGPPK